MSNHDLILPIKPLSFVDQEAILEAGDEIIVPRKVLDQWMDLFPPGMPMLARLTNMETDTGRIVCIGSSDSSDATYVPRWILEHLGYSGSDDQQVYMSPYLEEIPQAIRISLRPMDNAAYHSDLRKAFETYLDRFHVMESGTTICLPLEELGGYEVCSFVEQVEPFGIVRLGGEVQIEFLEPEGGIPEHEEPPSVPAVENEVVTEIPVLQKVPTKEELEAIRAARVRYFTNQNLNKS
jgi:hypothetical protein